MLYEPTNCLAGLWGHGCVIEELDVAVMQTTDAMRVHGKIC